MTDANANLSSYVYDGFDRLSELHFPVPALGANAASATDYEAYGYDANSNRTSVRLRSGETIAFGYDALNRESLRDLPGAAANDVYSAYDLAGRRQSARFASAGGQGVIYAYDSAGRLASETSTLGTSRALTYQYDAASNRTRITWPDGVFAQYTYDALNRVDLVQENGTTLLADYAYDPLSRRTSITRGNGTTAAYSYDSASRLTNLTQDLSGTINDQTLGFSYTAASQISQRTAANDNYNWTGPNVTRTYNRNGLNQYTSVSGTNYTYDARGNLTSDGSRTFAYDLENRLLSVSGSASLALAYDPLGRLRSTTAAGSTTDFLYDGDRLVGEYNSAGALLRRYVHGPGVDEPLVSYEGAGLTDRRYLIANHQGSVIAEEGAATTRYSYGPYGEPDSWIGARFRYTGQIALPEAQLFHYKARVYDPVLGRFLQTDPVGYDEDVNLYGYVANDPISGADPSGMNASAGCAGFSSGASFVTCSPGAAAIDSGGESGSGETLFGARQAQQHFEGSVGTPSALSAAARNVVSNVAAATASFARENPDVIIGIATLIIPTPIDDIARAALPLRFSQTTASRLFSPEGAFAGRSITQVANAIRSGEIAASSVGVRYVVRDGTALIVNARSSLALRQAGVPPSQWRLMNSTGNPTIEAEITRRLAANGLTSTGTATVRVTGLGRSASAVGPR